MGKLVTLCLIALSSSTSLASEIEYYRKALAVAVSHASADREFLLMNMPQALGNPNDLDASGSPMDIAFMDVIPHEQLEWAPSAAKVSSVYASIFQNYRLGYRRQSVDERTRYQLALSRLYRSPDPALLARGELPTARLTDRALDYFTRNGTVLRRLLSEDHSSVGVSDLLDTIVTGGIESEVAQALREVRAFQRSDAESVWAQRSTLADAGTFHTNPVPSRESWDDESGWASVLLPASTNPGIAVTLEVKTISVQRPWLDDAMFSERNWYSLDSSDEPLVISTGEALSDLRGKTSGSQMLLLPVEFLLARKVRRVGVWTVADEQSLPLSLRPSVADADKGSDPVVIAVVCRRLPRSPRPDLSLDWPRGIPR